MEIHPNKWHLINAGWRSPSSIDSPQSLHSPLESVRACLVGTPTMEKLLLNLFIFDFQMRDPGKRGVNENQLTQHLITLTWTIQHVTPLLFLLVETLDNIYGYHNLFMDYDITWWLTSWKQWLWTLCGSTQCWWLLPWSSDRNHQVWMLLWLQLNNMLQQPPALLMTRLSWGTLAWCHHDTFSCLNNTLKGPQGYWIIWGLLHFMNET